VEEDLDVVQGVSGSTGYVRDRSLSAKFLEFFPVAVVVKGGADHGVEGGREVAAIQRFAHVGRRRWWRVMEDAMFMGHRLIVPSPPARHAA
jgi:hypothetical protein